MFFFKLSFHIISQERIFLKRNKDNHISFCSDMVAAINFPCFDVCWQEEGGKKIDVLEKIAKSQVCF